MTDLGLVDELASCRFAFGATGGGAARAGEATIVVAMLALGGEQGAAQIVYAGVIEAEQLRVAGEGGEHAQGCVEVGGIEGVRGERGEGGGERGELAAQAGVVGDGTVIAVAVGVAAQVGERGRRERAAELEAAQAGGVREGGEEWGGVEGLREGEGSPGWIAVEEGGPAGGVAGMVGAGRRDRCFAGGGGVGGEAEVLEVLEVLAEGVDGGAVEVVVGEVEGVKRCEGGEGGEEQCETGGAELVAREIEVLDGRVAGDEFEERGDGVGADAAVGEPEAAQGPGGGDRGEHGGVGEAAEIEVSAGEDGGVAGAEATRGLVGEVSHDREEVGVGVRAGHGGASTRAAAMIHSRPMAAGEAAIEVAMIVARTEAEGPGLRWALWVQGCPLRCPGCCNPEMLEFRPADRRAVAELIEEAAAVGVEGVSLLGGEPFAQAAGLALLAEGVRARGLSVMVYSGFTLAELQGQGEDAARLLAATDLLVDGRFEAKLRSQRRRFIGSDNQGLHFLTGRYQADDPRLAGSNHVELRMRGGEITINGWPLLGARTRVGG